MAKQDCSIQEEMKPGTIISGRVLDSLANRPLSNALVIETVENDTAAYYYTVTDEEGRFSYPLSGANHVLKVIADTYISVTVPLDKTTFHINLKKASDGYEKDDVTYVIGPFNISDILPENKMNLRSGSDIRVVKQEELTDDCTIEGGIIK